MIATTSQSGQAVIQLALQKSTANSPVGAEMILGNLATYRPTPFMISVSGDFNHSCALTPAGAVECWGATGNWEKGQVSDTPVLTDNLPSTAFERDDDVRCSVTANDYFQNGNTETSAAANINNSAPAITNVVVTPDPAASSGILGCSYDFSDADNDADASSISWVVNGNAAGISTTLSSGFAAGDEVSCTVTPDDALDVGTPVSSPSITINTPATISNVSIEQGEHLVCDYTFSDTNADPDNSSVTWTINGTTMTVDDGVYTHLSSGAYHNCAHIWRTHRVLGGWRRWRQLQLRTSRQCAIRRWF